MSDETQEEKLEDISNAPIEPLEVIVKNPPEKKKSDFDSVDDSQYEDMYPTKELIKEYEEEDGET